MISEADIESVRIVPMTTHVTGSNHGVAGEWHKDARPFADVFIVAAGRHYYSRVFHTIDGSPHAIAAQKQDFLTRAKRHGY